MTFQQAIASGFHNYVRFSGRASRSEYWYWALFMLICGIVTAIIDALVFPDNSISPLNSLFNLAVFLPSLAVAVRRLHDIGRTGWWVLVSLTVIGIILLIVFFSQKSDPGPNPYGVPPA
jgi:uncharacterized membrane protein YhaH (DUF805 family)